MQIKATFNISYRYVCLLGIALMGCIGPCWKTEIPMADGKNRVEIELQTPRRLLLTLKSSDQADCDSIILEDTTSEIRSFWISLPRMADKDIYIFDPSELVKEVKCNRFEVHVVREWVVDAANNTKQWIEPGKDIERESYYIFPSYRRVDKL